ncbi:hypothetical protein ACGFMM_24290 [Streptomyces sp. NPDC048604]|uniref:hypothetical protein n=1 Tax=Streptomyces sp. NPDC048604 TaxID=3365578 RepID=UPI0037207DAC
MRPGTNVTLKGLRLLLNEWDPIGVADEVPDEYDCMLAPVLKRLRAGADEAELGEFLRHHVEDHFGLTPLPSATEAAAARVVSWWTAAGSAHDTGSV